MGRGHKVCPGCKAEVGPRTKICLKCEHEFTFKQGKEPGRYTHKRVRALRVEEPFEALTENPTEVVGIADRKALDSFIEQIQACREDSDQNGGCYSAFLHHKQGVLKIEVQLTMILRDAR